MIEKIKITKWTYWISVFILIISVFSLLTFVYPNLSRLEIPFGIIIYCIYLSPILILLLLIDYLFNNNLNKKRFFFSLLVNVAITLLAYYYLSHLFDNLWV